MGVDFDKLNKDNMKKKSPSPSFKGRIPKTINAESEVLNEEDSTSSEEESTDVQQPELRRERHESIDMPLFDSNSKDKSRENSKGLESEGEGKICDSKKAESSPISDDLEISDSDESNSKSKDVSDQENSSQGKVQTESTVNKNEVEVEDPDDYLLYLEDILKTIHKAYYDLYDQSSVPAPDLNTVIPYVKRKVLTGVVIVFSGVVPTQVLCGVESALHWLLYPAGASGAQ